MIINRSPRFKRSYQKLPVHIQESFITRIRLFAESPFHPQLKTHKLKGNLQECWAFELRDGFRVYFEFVTGSEINLLYTGPHDRYGRWK